jgi:hypothetical protein
MTLARWLLLTVAVLVLIGVGIGECVSDSRTESEARGRWRVDTFLITTSQFGHGKLYYDHVFLDDQRIAPDAKLDSCILEPDFAPTTLLCCESIPESSGRRLVVYTAQSMKGKYATRSLGGIAISGAQAYCQMNKRLAGPDDPRWVEGKFRFVRTIENPGYRMQMQDVEFDPRTGRVTSTPRSAPADNGPAPEAQPPKAE